MDQLLGPRIGSEPRNEGSGGGLGGRNQGCQDGLRLVKSLGGDACSCSAKVAPLDFDRNWLPVFFPLSASFYWIAEYIQAKVTVTDKRALVGA